MLSRGGPATLFSAAPGELQMDSNISDVIVGLMMAGFGFIGLFLAAGAADAEMTVFGFALSGFAVCFDFGLIRRHYDRRDAARGDAIRGDAVRGDAGRGGARNHPHV